MESESIKKSLFSGLIWTSGGQFLTVIVNLSINIVLAKFLSPDQFGVMGIIMFFVLLGDVLAKGGLSGALIRMEKVNPLDYSTVFVFNLIVSTILYIILWISSEEISIYYGHNEIEILLRITGLTLIVNAFQLINITNLVRSWKFKKRFIFEFSSTLIASIISVVLALNDFGIWALALLPLNTSLFLTIFLILSEGFHGGYMFSFKSFKKTYKFGVNTTLASLIETTFENIYSLVLGRYFSVTQVGYFYQAQKLQKVPNNILNSFSQRVLFPVLSKSQNNKLEFSRVYNKINILFTVFVGLFGLFIFIFSKPIILLLFGSKWLGSVFYLQLFIVASFFYMQEQFNRIIFKVFDKTSNILVLEIIKKVFQIITIIFGVYYLNIKYLIFGYVLTSVFSFFINFSRSRKIINSDFFGEIAIVLKIFICGLVCVFINNFCLTIFEFKYLIYFLFPFLILLYFAFLNILNVCNISDLKNILNFLNLKKIIK